MAQQGVGAAEMLPFSDWKDTLTGSLIKPSENHGAEHKQPMSFYEETVEITKTILQNQCDEKLAQIRAKIVEAREKGETVARIDIDPHGPLSEWIMCSPALKGFTFGQSKDGAGLEVRWQVHLLPGSFKTMERFYCF